MWARGEMRAGRGIVRVVTAEDGDGDGDGDGFAPATGTGAGAGSVYKFLLQDSRGRLVWGVDCDAVFSVAGLIGTAAGAGVANQVTIGTKILLRNGCRVDRGVVRIEGAFVTVLGGRIEGLEKIWREGRIERLKLLLAGEE